MAIYLGSEKQKVYIGSSQQNFAIGSFGAIELNKLLSSDGFVLVDINGLYLIPKEDE